MRSLTLTLLLTACAALEASAQQQPQPATQFGERMEVNVVLIDAVVTDSRGNQILGLGKEDFTVTENGSRQPVDSVDYFSSRRLLNTAESRAPFKVEPVQEGRYIVFFFDKPADGSMFQKVAQARRAVAGFIDRDMGADDHVAIVGHDVRLKVFSDFTSNKAQLKKGLEDAARFSRGIVTAKGAPEGPSILRNIAANKMMDGTGRVYEAIQTLAGALRPIRGRKNLVLFSPGIIEPGEEVRGGVLLNTSRFYQPMVEALNAANVSVYAANLLLDEAPTAPAVHQTLERMAHDTSGEYFRQIVTFNPLVKAVEKVSGGYYLITYRTEKPRFDRGFQKVEVAVANPEFRIKARPGYVYGD